MKWHYIITLQWGAGSGLVTVSGSGTLDWGNSRSEVFNFLLGRFSSQYGLPSEKFGILFFSLEPDAL